MTSMTLGGTQIKVRNLKPTTIVLPLAGPAGSGGSGGGVVASVFGRINAVVALAGDYAAFYDALGAAGSAVADEVTARNTAITNAIAALGLGNIVTHSASDFVTPAQQTAAIAALVNAAPTLLDTLSEIDAAINNDPNFATTIATQMATKAVDTAVVHNTGTETIAGVKTFNNSPVVPDGSFAEAKVIGLVADLAALSAAITAAITTAHNDAASQITALGLGTASTKNTGTGSGQVGLLGAGGTYPVGLLGSGVPDGTKFLRDDGSFVTPAGGGGSALLAILAYNPNPAVIFTGSSTTLADIDANLAITFTVPASGRVLVGLYALWTATINVNSYWALRNGSTEVPASLGLVGWDSSGVRISLRTLITGLTPGASLTWKWAYKTDSGTVHMSYGDNGSSNRYGASTMEVWAA